MGSNELESRHYPIHEDMPLQRRMWRFERLGWLLFCLIVLLTLLGVFSHGPLSNAMVTSADQTLQVEYERFVRNGATLTMVISVQSNATRPAALTFEGRLVDAFIIENIQPQPDSTQASGNGQTISIMPDGDGRAVVHVTLKADAVGRVDGSITLNDAAKIGLTHWIYP